MHQLVPLALRQKWRDVEGDHGDIQVAGRNGLIEAITLRLVGLPEPFLHAQQRFACPGEGDGAIRGVQHGVYCLSDVLRVQLSGPQRIIRIPQIRVQVVHDVDVFNTHLRPP